MYVCMYLYVLLVKEETAQQGMIYGKVEIGKCYWVEMEVEKINEMSLSRHPFTVQIMIDQNEPNNVEYFIYFSNVMAIGKSSIH